MNRHEKLQVLLSHAPNPDILPDGYWEPPVEPGTEQWVEVDSLEVASRVCREYITGNGLGAGNWTGGLIRLASGLSVGQVSYNGRIQS